MRIAPFVPELLRQYNSTCGLQIVQRAFYILLVGFVTPSLELRILICFISSNLNDFLLISTTILLLPPKNLLHLIPINLPAQIAFIINTFNNHAVSAFTIRIKKAETCFAVFITD